MRIRLKQNGGRGDLMRIRLKQNGGRGEIRTHGGL
ncbi:MAG: hypothetical protein RLZ90_733 [Pseudomonadota bacterium]